MIGKKFFDKKTRSIWIIKEATLKHIELVSEDGTMKRKMSYESFAEKVGDQTLYEINN